MRTSEEEDEEHQEDDCGLWRTEEVGGGRWRTIGGRRQCEEAEDREDQYGEAAWGRVKWNGEEAWGRVKWNGK